MKKFLSTRLALKFLCVALSMVLISCVGASFLQTDFGKVQISKFKIPSDNGTWIEGNLFILSQQMQSIKFHSSLLVTVF